jgi:hypothetical protein
MGSMVFTRAIQKFEYLAPCVFFFPGVVIDSVNPIVGLILTSNQSN